MVTSHKCNCICNKLRCQSMTYRCEFPKQTDGLNSENLLLTYVPILNEVKDLGSSVKLECKLSIAKYCPPCPKYSILFNLKM